mmetsp:Transcript_6119/g.16638  ORF Transcript_6119/g.16638 Transcript_6119/m.16638 type:complete len:462 (-) Transcript_6119:103-1488(-)
MDPLAADHVRVHPLWQRRLQAPRLPGIAARVQGDVPSSVACKGHPRAACRCREGRERRVGGLAAEPHHLEKCWLPVLADPAGAAPACALWWALARIGKVVTGHQTGVTVWMRQQERIRKRVKGTVIECHGVLGKADAAPKAILAATATSAVSSPDIPCVPLQVVIVSERHRLVRGHVAGGVSEAPQHREVPGLEGEPDLRSADELHVARLARGPTGRHFEVLGRSDLATSVHDVLHHGKRHASGDRRENRVQLRRWHVPRGIDAYAVHTSVGQPLDEGHQFPLHRCQVRVQVGEAHQVALLQDPPRNAVHLTIGGQVLRVVVELFWRVEAAEVPVAERCASNADSPPGSACAGHVVEHGVHVHAHSRGVAPPHHVDELALVPAAGVELVAHRLVPPVPVLARQVLVGRVHTHRVVAVWPEHLLALARDRAVLPLEQVRESIGFAAGAGNQLQAVCASRRSN